MDSVNKQASGSLGTGKAL